jgi:hypothetical protein
MSNQLRIRINEPAVIFDEADGEYVVINLLTGHYFRLDSISSRLWKALAETPTKEELFASTENSADLQAAWPAIAENLLAAGLIEEVELSAVSPALATWSFNGFELQSFTDLEDILGLDPIHEVDPQQGWPKAAGE